MSPESWPSPCRLYTRSLNQSYVLSLLYVTQGERQATRENPLCSSPFWTMSAMFFTSPLNVRETNVAPDAIAREIGSIGFSITPTFGVDFVFIPFSAVGEACPVVSPYTWLFITMYVMSRLRRIACIVCPRPIPYPSPSPPVTITWRSGFASLMPVATGIERPWIEWNPYVDRKWGRLLEQPMPDTRTMFHGSSCIAWIAFWRAFRTAKSPQPGHHVGLIWDLYVWSSNAAFIVPPRGSSRRSPRTRKAPRRTCRRSDRPRSRSPCAGAARTDPCSCPRRRGSSSRRAGARGSPPRGGGTASGTRSRSP